MFRDLAVLTVCTDLGLDGIFGCRVNMIIFVVELRTSGSHFHLVREGFMEEATFQGVFKQGEGFVPGPHSSNCWLCFQASIWEVS